MYRIEKVTTLIAIKARLISILVATMIALLVVPTSPASANGNYCTFTSGIQGVTPPVAGATPVETITATTEYTGTVEWSSSEGPLTGNFETATIYKAIISLDPVIENCTFDGIGENFFRVEGASLVTNPPDSGTVTAYFTPSLGRATQFLDESFGFNGSVSIHDIFGASLLTESGTVVGPIKVDQIAVDSKDRIVVLASFIESINPGVEVSRADGINIGTGYQNSVNIAEEADVEGWSSAAVAAREYTSTTFNDWYLPSQEELRALYQQRAIAVGMSLNSSYWSSSQGDEDTAITMNFASGMVSNTQKSVSLRVRPIRAGETSTALIGDTGPGGGVIYYVSDTPFDCGPDLSLNCNYLEVAPNDWHSPYDPGSEDDPTTTWAAFLADNHILFRLNANGSYDSSFGNQELHSTNLSEDRRRSYVLITTTCPYYSTERVDLKIASQDRILVMLSGSASINECGGRHHNFVARYKESGNIDTDFGDGGDGVIGTFEPQLLPPKRLFDQITLDGDGHILAASLSYETYTVVVLERFSPVGLIDNQFGEGGIRSVEVISPDAEGDMPYRDLRVIADDAGGYVVAFTGVAYVFSFTPFPFTELFRIDVHGNLDNNFKAPPESGSSDPEREINPLILPFFFLTDLAPDGPSGFIVSGTFYLPINDGDIYGGIYGVMIRFAMNGNLDFEFNYIIDSESNDSREEFLFDPQFSYGCPNSALFKNDSTDNSIVGVLVGNLCPDGDGRLKAFSSGGIFQGEISLATTTPNYVLQFISQLEGTQTGKLLILNGARPKTGFFSFAIDFAWQPEANDNIWTNATISRYLLPVAITPPPVEAFIPPPPVPYLNTLTAPKIQLKDNKLICTPGTYNAGYTIGGVNQGSSTSLFTPATFTYNLFVNGVQQNSLTVTSASATVSWSVPTTTSGALITCSVTVSANGVTNTDRSSDNTAGINEAAATQRSAIAAADSDYLNSLSANAKAYQKALIDNRTKWRSDTEKIRINYYAERDRLRSLPSTKATRALVSTAFKSYITAQKESASIHAASKPAAQAAKDAADKSALDAKSAATTKALTAYGSFLESIGYGVLIP